MAITRKPKSPETDKQQEVISEKAALEFIGRASVNQSKPANNGDGKKMITIHLLESEILRIDTLLASKKGRNKLSRRSWITKAIIDRLEQEED